MQESRLFKIVYQLLQKRRVTATELAKEYEVSVRTIYRDIDRLSEAGIPIYAEAGRKGGIYLLEEFTLDKMMFSQQERQDILASLQSLSVVGMKQEDAILSKVSALFQIKSDSWFEADFSRWGEKSRDLEKFEIVKKAVIERLALKISYESAYGGSSERVIYPLKLLYKSKEWYIKAYCTKKQDYRLFKLNRVIGWELLREEFAPMEFPLLEEEKHNNQRVVLRFTKDVAYRVYDEFDVKQVRIIENQELEVTAYMPVDEWIIGYLLSFGTQVEVVEPVEMRKTLVERALQIYEKNKT